MAEPTLSSKVAMFEASVRRTGLTSESLQELRDTMAAHGHKCLQIARGWGAARIIHWCESEGNCVEALQRRRMDTENKSMEDLAARLVSEGHKCVTIMESYPIQVGWCKKPAASCPQALNKL
jgi:hypothetical protein